MKAIYILAGAVGLPGAVCAIIYTVLAMTIGVRPDIKGWVLVGVAILAAIGARRGFMLWKRRHG